MALNVAPLNAPHKELEWMPLADKDFEITNMIGDKPHLQAFCEIRNSYRSNIDVFGI